MVKIQIFNHAVDNYLDRVLKINPEMAGDGIRNFCRREIERAIENPEEIYREKKEMPPAVIRGDAAVIIANRKEDDKYYFDIQSDDPILVPTVYNKETFIPDKETASEKEVSIV